MNMRTLRRAFVGSKGLQKYAPILGEFRAVTIMQEDLTEYACVLLV